MKTSRFLLGAALAALAMCASAFAASPPDAMGGAPATVQAVANSQGVAPDAAAVKDIGAVHAVATPQWGPGAGGWSTFPASTKPATKPAQVSNDVSPVSLQVADTGTGAASAYQAWVNQQTALTDCSTCRVAASVHPGCGQREPHPLMSGKKGGGGKRCIERTGFARIETGAKQRPFTRST